jgi:uncharacterized protein YgiM (DUF1202 family)
MKSKKSRIYLMIVFLVISSLACSLSDLTGGTATQDPGALDTAVAKSMAETASIQTAIAQGVASVAVPTQGGSSGAGPTIQVQPSETASLTVSPTSGKAMVSVSNATNCRSGPGTVYDWLGALNPGQEVEILGKDPSSSSYYIRNPTNQTGFCWIWNTYATVTGDLGAVPVYTPMPTPTPAKTSTPTTPPVGFNVTFNEIFVCGNYYIEFNITNTGSLIWQSYYSALTDTNLSVTSTSQWDKFEDYSGCTMLLAQDDLSPGETGQAWSGGFASSPAGHLINATIKLCTADALGGTCASKSITFTP